MFKATHADKLRKEYTHWTRLGQATYADNSPQLGERKAHRDQRPRCRAIMTSPTDRDHTADDHLGKVSAVAYIERGQALYTQLANTLREQITSGALPPGSPLPSEAEMKTAYGVSRPTARAAINALRAEGIVTVLHGKGSFVRHGDTPHT
ncbi:MAG: winged helix-turn-helix domain-containing protein, partial [Pseudonocardiaceae bacterium]